MATIEKQHYVHAHGMPLRGKILMVASSPAVSEQTGWPIGFWAAELTHPLRVFREAGYEVVLASTEGGALQMDAYSDPTDASAYFYEADKPSAAVCHSTTLLLEARTSDGELLVKGKSWTGFADAEEEIADQAVGQRIQPYWIESEARQLPDTDFKVAAPFSSYAIADGRLITGQQQNSGAAAARLLVAQLAAQ